MNSINENVLDELKAALEEAEESKIRCVVLQGAGENFSAGVDIGEFMPPDLETYHKLSRKSNKLNKYIESIPIPVVAAIRGNCLGGGLEMALACDFRIAGKDAKLGQPEGNLGLIPGAGGTQRLPRIVGIAKAKEVIMTGKNISADEALNIGLVNRVVPVNDLQEEVRNFASDLAGGSPFALKYAKLSINFGTEAPRDIGKELESSLFASLASLSDTAEGIEAFMEKREPEFKGE